jgi:hypothetical protein
VTLHEEPLHYGVMAELPSVGALIEAIHRARAAGYRKIEAYTPSPSHEVIEALDLPRSPLPFLVLGGGITGALTGYLMQYGLLVHAYPLNVGGRPLHSWPYFIPITFECTILFAALTAVLSVFALSGLPMPYHALFNVPGFAAASRDRFFLVILAADPSYDHAGVLRFCDGLGARHVAEVPT